MRLESLFVTHCVKLRDISQWMVILLASWWWTIGNVQDRWNLWVGGARGLVFPPPDFARITSKSYFMKWFFSPWISRPSTVPWNFFFGHWTNVVCSSLPIALDSVQCAGPMRPGGLGGLRLLRYQFIQY